MEIFFKIMDARLMDFIGDPMDVSNACELQWTLRGPH
jgi:hypothetical protein